MKARSFIQFTAPSVLLMLGLLALPLLMTFWLSVHNCALDLELVTVQQTGLVKRVAGKESTADEQRIRIAEGGVVQPQPGFRRIRRGGGASRFR